MRDKDDVLEGKAILLGDNVDTDLIIPATYLVTSDAGALGEHLFEGLGDDFVSRLGEGRIIVAGTNFGSGSSREHAPLAIKGRGISCVVAKSFARIFFRNAVNVGLAIVECPSFVSATKDDDMIKVDLLRGKVENVTRGRAFDFVPYPPFMRRIIDAGGLIEYIMSSTVS
ncbi:MAG: 3-isopropylmalate dehydratase small subunit [Actinomycetota bacterium]|nr:3-isopropylmalate dehydratase small subunit [Actinomycetota bacterium]